MAPRTVAVAGAAGGVGTTRLTVELGAALARDGRSVALLDAAFGTQGLAGYVPGRIETDITALLVRGDDGVSLEETATPVAGDPPGRLVAVPAYAPFERLARAKTPAAAQALEALIEEAATAFDRVLVDTPPVAANQAVAAVTAADRVGVVTVPGDRGVDSLQRARGRLADLGVEGEVVVANRADGEHPDADAAVPESRHAEPDAPACLKGQTPFAATVATTAETLFETEVAVEFDESVLAQARRLLAPSDGRNQ